MNDCRVLIMDNAMVQLLAGFFDRLFSSPHRLSLAFLQVLQMALHPIRHLHLMQGSPQKIQQPGK